MRGAQNRSPTPNRTPGRYPTPAVPKIALRVLAPRYPERLPAHPPCDAAVFVVVTVKAGAEQVNFVLLAPGVRPRCFLEAAGAISDPDFAVV